MRGTSEIGKRKIVNAAALTLACAAAGLGLFWLIFILADVLRHGIAYITPGLFLNEAAPPGMEGGGLKHAFIGQLLITLFAVLIGIPLGILGGTWLAEYGRHHSIGRFISTLSDIMISVPSIVIGTFVYAIFVKPIGHFSGFAGALALAIIMLPVVLRTTEEMMKLVPWEIREAAFALGAPYYKVILQVVYRGAATGIFTGILLAIARIAGETAPLLFTSFNNMFLTTNMNEPMPSLTVTIYQYAMGPYDDWHEMAWAASFVITLFILGLTILGRLIIRWKYKN
ncbi:MAG: phosphate ABC transporter permease PstA [Desulfuromonadales bacterium]|nr:phosphate ABC transporter permease PstA [Desulfuromonadales bacterium]